MLCVTGPIPPAPSTARSCSSTRSHSPGSRAAEPGQPAPQPPPGREAGRLLGVLQRPADRTLTVPRTRLRARSTAHAFHLCTFATLSIPAANTGSDLDKRPTPWSGRVHRNFTADPVRQAFQEMSCPPRVTTGAMQMLRGTQPHAPHTPRKPTAETSTAATRTPTCRSPTRRPKSPLPAPLHRLLAPGHPPRASCFLEESTVPTFEPLPRFTADLQHLTPPSAGASAASSRTPSYPTCAPADRFAPAYESSAYSVPPASTRPPGPWAPGPQDAPLGSTGPRPPPAHHSCIGTHDILTNM